MTKARVATMWLDGCSGCHMSMLDVDEAIIAIAGKIDMVYGPLVDAQEFPENVDVAIVEGAVSNQHDLDMIRKARARSRILVALGDCAVTSNVPAMRNAYSVRTILERVYVEGADEQKGAGVLLRRYSDRNLTMTDAVGLHLMEQRRVASCWSTDFHLALGGVQLVINDVR